jgi:hypothetical protein
MDIHEVQVGWSLATGSLLLGQSPMALLFFKKVMVVMGCWHPLEVVREHDMELEQSLCVLQGNNAVLWNECRNTNITNYMTKS